MATEDKTSHPDFARLGGRVYRLCLALLGDESLARDAAQESLLRAWSRRGRRRGDVSWWTWTAGFAIRVCREAKRERRPRGTGDGVDAWPPAGTDDGVDRARDRLALVHEAVLRLPQRQREVVVLRMILGHSTEQTARALACPGGTVKSNLYKALMSLRAAVADPALTDDL
ncbi:MAG: RNA polymerase sigma factor [Phycisphaerae bacterium]